MSTIPDRSIRKLKKRMRTGRDRERGGTKVMQIGVDSLHSRGRGFLRGFKSLFRRRRDSSSEEEEEEEEIRLPVHPELEQIRPVASVAVQAPRRTSSKQWRQDCRVGEGAVHVAGRRGIYDREGLPTDLSLIGSSPSGSYTPTELIQTKAPEPEAEAPPHHECPDCPFGESSDSDSSWKGSEDGGAAEAKAKASRSSVANSLHTPTGRQSRSLEEKASTHPRATSPEQESKSFSRSKTWPRLSKNLELSSSRQDNGKLGAIKNAEYIHSSSTLEDSYMAIKIEDRPKSSPENNKSEKEQPTHTTNSDPAEESQLCTDDNISSMELQTRPLPHLFATGCRGLSPGIERPPSSTSLPPIGYGNLTLSELLPSIDEASVTSDFPPKYAFMADKLLDENTRTLVPDAYHIPEPRLISHVRYLPAALQEAIDTEMPNIFSETQNEGDTIATEVSVALPTIETIKRPPISIMIPESAPEPSELDGTAWSFVDNHFEGFDGHHFDKFEEKVLSKSTKGSPRPPNVFQVSGLSSSNPAEELIFLLDIESTADDFGFKPTLAPMPGSWPYLPRNEDTSEVDEQETIEAVRSMTGQLALESSVGDLDISEHLENSQYVSQNEDPGSTLTYEGTLMFTRCRPIPGCVEPPPSPVSSSPAIRISLDYGPLTPFCSPSTSPRLGSGSFSVRLRGGAGESGVTDIFMPAKEKGNAEAGRELLKQQMGKFDCWVVGYQPKPGETWKTFVRKTEERIEEARRVKPQGKMTKFGTALGGAFKGLFAEEGDANDTSEAKDAMDANKAEAVQHKAKRKRRRADARKLAMRTGG